MDPNAARIGPSLGYAKGRETRLRIVLTTIDPVVDEVKEATRGHVSLSQLIHGFCKLPDALVDFMIRPAGTGKWARKR